jgi:hypothetical protein
LGSDANWTTWTHHHFQIIRQQGSHAKPGNSCFVCAANVHYLDFFAVFVDELPDFFGKRKCCFVTPVINVQRPTSVKRRRRKIRSERLYLLDLLITNVNLC